MTTHIRFIDLAIGDHFISLVLYGSGRVGTATPAHLLKKVDTGLNVPYNTIRTWDGFEVLMSGDMPVIKVVF